MPLSWTDRATPSSHGIVVTPEARLSALALLEVVRLLENWREKKD
jgi:hypothetical protein